MADENGKVSVISEKWISLARSARSDNNVTHYLYGIKMFLAQLVCMQIFGLFYNWIQYDLCAAR